MAKLEERGGLLASTAPSYLARDVLEGEDLLKCMGMWLQYDPRRNCYRELTNDHMTSLIWHKLDGRRYMKGDEEKVLNMTRSICEEVRMAMIHLTLQPDVEALPAWRGGEAPRGKGKKELPEDAGSLVVFRNCLLDWRTDEEHEPTPDLIATVATDVEYDMLATCPKWDAFLLEIFDGDQEQADLLHEIMGLLVAGETKFQKIFYLLGPPRSGKGTVIRMITKLVSIRNIASPKMSQLRGSGFNLASLINKHVAIVSDAEPGRRGSNFNAVETLKTVSGGDPQTIPRKNLDDWIGYLSCQFLFASNDLPRLDDGSGALASRFCALRTARSFLGREDEDLFSRDLEPEAPGVMNRALDGLKRVTERGRLLRPGAQEEIELDLFRATSTVAAFARECVFSTDGDQTKEEFYGVYKRYCEGLGLPVHDARQFWEKMANTGVYDKSMTFKARRKARNGRLMLKDERPYCVRGLIANDDFVEYQGEGDELFGEEV